MIEAVLETQGVPTLTTKTGVINALAVGDVAVVGVGTLFTTEYVVGELISILATNGKRLYQTIKTITDNLNIILTQGVPYVTAGSDVNSLAVPNSPYVIGGDVNAIGPNELPIYCPVFGFVLNAGNVTLLGFNFLFSKNEGALFKSIYMRYPYQYTGAAKNHILRFIQSTKDETQLAVIGSVGVSGQFPLPVENIETPMSAFAPAFRPVEDQAWFLRADIMGCKQSQEVEGSNFFDATTQPTLSNVDSPVVLDGEFMPVIIGARVVYSIALTSS